MVVAPPNHNERIGKIAALKRKPKQQEALNLLTDISNLVKPIMNEYGFNVKELCEFFPKNRGLLGMNVNRGGRIYIRLRPAFDELVFLPMEELVGTMLHELTHNRFGPHDSKFYKLFEELKDEFEQFQVNEAKYRLGGGRFDREQRIKRLSVKKFSEVNRLGSGSGPGAGGGSTDLKELVRQAAIRRYEDNKWCHDGTNKEDLPSDDELFVVIKEGDVEVIEILDEPERSGGGEGGHKRQKLGTPDQKLGTPDQKLGTPSGDQRMDEKATPGGGQGGVTEKPVNTEKSSATESAPKKSNSEVIIID